MFIMTKIISYIKNLMQWYEKSEITLLEPKVVKGYKLQTLLTLTTIFRLTQVEKK